MLLPRTNIRLRQDVDKVLSSEHRRDVTAHQVDRDQLGLVRQGETCSAIMEEMESAVRSCGVDGISRYACRGVVGQRQLAQHPIIEGTWGKARSRRVLKRIQLPRAIKTACCKTEEWTTPAHTPGGHVGSFSRIIWTLRRIWISVRAGADSPNHPKSEGCWASRTPTKPRLPVAYGPARYIG